MAKKILGDDPFSSQAGPQKRAEAAADSKPKRKSNTKAKRAPSRKTEAPRETRATSKPAKRAAVVAKSTTPSDSPRVAAPSDDLKVTAKAAPSDGPQVTAKVEAPPAPPVVAVTEVSAITLSRSEKDASELPPADATPGSWRWWRYRQLQLSRTEDHAWLMRHPGEAKQDRYGRDPVLAGRAEPIVDLVYRSWLRVSVRGLGHVPEAGRAILVAKRRRAAGTGLASLALAPLARFGLEAAWSATLDAAIIAHAVRTEHVAHREVRPLVKSHRLYTPIVGPLLRRLGGVPADLHDFARLLDDDRLALAFVDDAAPRADALDLSTIVCLALVTGAPIIPITFGASSAHQRGMFRPQRSTALAFGTPLYLGTEFGPEGSEDDALVARLAAELSAQL